MKVLSDTFLSFFFAFASTKKTLFSPQSSFGNTLFVENHCFKKIKKMIKKWRISICQNKTLWHFGVLPMNPKACGGAEVIEDEKKTEGDLGSVRE
jgi:hypothetical protein